MSDDDFESDLDDEELNQVLMKTAVNRQVTERRIRHQSPPQRTLTGEIQQMGRVRYEEIQPTISFSPTHHQLNNEALKTFIYPSNLEMRDYQFDIIRKAFFKNLLCAIPTGMGKTFIASTVMLNYYRWFPKSKIIFMAPTRPLVAQQIQACLGVTDIRSDETAILLDKLRKNRPEIWNSKRVFFATPQVVENDLKSGSLNPKEIVCLIIDEAHRARGSYAYTNVVQFIKRFNSSFRVLALTATPAADIEGVQEVVKNLSISKIEIRTEESMDIVKYMKRKETIRIRVGLNSDMENIVEWLGAAIDDALKKANEANIYDVTDASRINAFQVLQKSQTIVKNPSIPEGLKWHYYFILQIIGYVGQMLRRLKIYGIRTFYSYYQNKTLEFKTKYSMKKSTNKIAKEFFYHPANKKIEDTCDKLLTDPSYVSHPKLEHIIDELLRFFDGKENSRVIIFTELRESALEIVKGIDHIAGDKCKAHIFIGQARAKEAFDDQEYAKTHGPKGGTKAQHQQRREKEQRQEEEKRIKKQNEIAERAGRRTYTSEEAQLQGMNQKRQKELIKNFRNGVYNILVATSIGEEGLDIGEVDLIICYDSTGSPIKNIQRMGRTGRKRDGKVILLLAGNEELKFDQSMEDYGFVQKQIARNALDLPKSDRIVPQDIQPECLKKQIIIPEENLRIAGGEDEDEVIKYATQAMLGQGKKKRANKTKNSKKKEPEKPKPPKRFFMPDNVQTGFVSSSKLVQKTVDGQAETHNGEGEGQISGSNTSLDLDEAAFDTAQELPPKKRQNTTTKEVNDDSKFNGSSSTPSRSIFLKPDISTMEEPVFPQSSAQDPFDNDFFLDLEDNQKDHIDQSGTTQNSKEMASPETAKVDLESIDSQDFSDSMTLERNLNKDSLHARILSFKAFEVGEVHEQECEHEFAHAQPKLEADKAMDKEEQLDPDYKDDVLFSSVPKNSNKKEISMKETGITKCVKECPRPKMEIASLLRQMSNRPKKRLGTRFQRTELSKIRDSQIIDLVDESDIGSQDNQNKEKLVTEINSRRVEDAKPKMGSYMSKNHQLFSTSFHADDGFLTEKEKNDFFAQYYSVLEPNAVEPDPYKTAVTTPWMAEIAHSSVSQRYLDLVHNMNDTEIHGLSGYDTAAFDKDFDVINSSDNVILDDEFNENDQTAGQLEDIEEGSRDGSPSILDNKSGDYEEEMTSISLLSDDEDFKNL